MKHYESHFEEYISANHKCNLHPKLLKMFKKFPTNIVNLKNLIFFGPSGVGKYTQMLSCISKYSPSELKYEKKISVNFNKQSYFIRISDIHYEVDMSLLGCNSKILWHEIYLQIIDIIYAKGESKTGIIVCKYFNEIHSELLENFYSYMQQNIALCINIKFILITEQLSFIPDNILNCCEVIHISRPSKSLYNKCLKEKLSPKFSLVNITNIKNTHCFDHNLMMPHKMICNKITDNLMNLNDLKFLKFRDVLYDIFIYNLDITQCIWYILSNLVEQNQFKEGDLSKILILTYEFFQYYNNNYRPIYHLEKYFFSLVRIIHKI
jgi:hypothetical protein